MNASRDCEPGSHPASVSDLAGVKDSINMLVARVGSLPRAVEAVTAAKAGTVSWDVTQVHVCVKADE